MSAPAVTERVQRLEEAGVIRGYRLDIDPAAIGLPVSAWVRVRPGPGQLTSIAKLAVDIPEVVECHRITGEDCFLLKVHVSAVDQLETVLDRFLLYGQTTSSIVQSSPVPPGLPHCPFFHPRAAGLPKWTALGRSRVDQPSAAFLFQCQGVVPSRCVIWYDASTASVSRMTVNGPSGSEQVIVRSG